MEKRFVIVRVHFMAVHFWPQAPPERQYLKVVHPHEFEVILRVQVFKANREIETHELREKLWNYLITKQKMGPWSCETLAREIAMRLRSWYPSKQSRYPRETHVIVLEDGVTGGEFHYVPDSGLPNVAKGA